VGNNLTGIDDNAREVGSDLKCLGRSSNCTFVQLQFTAMRYYTGFLKFSYVTVEHCNPKANRLLAYSVPTGFWGEEGKGKREGREREKRETASREKTGKGNEVKGRGQEKKMVKGKGREEVVKAKGRRERGKGNGGILCSCDFSLGKP